MLILTFRNVSDLAAVSSYEWCVLENHDVLAHGRIEGHRRSDGWEALVCKFAAEVCWKEDDNGKEQ